MELGSTYLLANEGRVMPEGTAGLVISFDSHRCAYGDDYLRKVQPQARPQRLTSCLTKPCRLTQGGVTVTQWQDRRLVGEAHERQVAAALTARGWTVHPCGQGTYPPPYATP
ncbi:hypothetical protein GCM10009730_51630 [Streptomyces albidochromogenes]